MSDRYYFPGEFRCMSCKEDLDPEGMLALPSGDQINLRCSRCGAIGKFQVCVQLNHKLVKGGMLNKHMPVSGLTFLRVHKNFDGWNEEKKTLHDATPRPPFISEREIWWCSFGVNVGREQDGRGDNFERPVVIIRTLSPDTCMVLPLSTKKRLEQFQSLVTHGTVRGFALLDQARVIDTKRLRRKIGMMEEAEFVAMTAKFQKLFR